MQHVFGERAGLEELPTLSRLYSESPGRPAFQKLLASRPEPVTGRGMAAEAEIIGRIRASLAS
jgi:hypothetical protein